MFGITQKGIDKLSAKMKGGWRDILFIFITRIIPFIPTTPISFVCGILKINLKSFLLVSFVGTTIRNMFFLYVGYIGASNYNLLHTAEAEKVISVIMLFVLVGLLIWYFVWKRQSKKSINVDKD
jgi:uncharacterized membrane protein YdjX (TVP38/TMEM64 family)